MHLYGWKKELKTGIYYLRSKPAVNAKKMTVNKVEPIKPVVNLDNFLSKEEQEYKAFLEAAKNSDEDDCEACGA